jgi:hypothetical protein
MTKITESAIDLFEKVGHDYIYALPTASHSDNLLLKTMSGKVMVDL